MTGTSALVSIIDDDASVRTGLARLVKAAGYDVETFASAHEYLNWPRPEEPGCLLLDVLMPGLSGLELQEALARTGRRVSIVFSGLDDVRDSVKAMKSGAVDFLTKPVDDRELLEAIERAVTKALQDRRDQAVTRDIYDRIKTLTPREAQVFALVVTGKLNRQIAVDLGSGEKTVKVHRGRVMEKMRARSVAELVRLADQGDAIKERDRRKTLIPPPSTNVQYRAICVGP